MEAPAAVASAAGRKVTYTFVGTAGNKTLDVSWHRSKYLICAQYKTSGNNLGAFEADNELAHYFAARRDYVPKGAWIKQRTFGGVPSDCWAAADSFEKTKKDTVCVAHAGGFMTYLNLPGARWTAHATAAVDAAELALPKGVHVLSLGESTPIIPSGAPIILRRCARGAGRVVRGTRRRG